MTAQLLSVRDEQWRKHSNISIFRQSAPYVDHRSCLSISTGAGAGQPEACEGSCPLISRADLRKIARARIKDAEALAASRRYDGAVYLCGYAVELWLKARICRTLSWAEYPSTRREFENYQSFRTHDLDVLLRLSGIESKVKAGFMAEWSIVAQWDPSARYSTAVAHAQDAHDMLMASKTLVKIP